MYRYSPPPQMEKEKKYRRKALHVQFLSISPPYIFVSACTLHQKSLTLASRTQGGRCLLLKSLTESNLYLLAPESPVFPLEFSERCEQTTRGVRSTRLRCILYMDQGCRPNHRVWKLKLNAELCECAYTMYTGTCRYSCALHGQVVHVQESLDKYFRSP